MPALLANALKLLGVINYPELLPVHPHDDVVALVDLKRLAIRPPESPPDHPVQSPSAPAPAVSPPTLACLSRHRPAQLGLHKPALHQHIPHVLVAECPRIPRSPSGYTPPGTTPGSCPPSSSARPQPRPRAADSRRRHRHRTPHHSCSHNTSSIISFDRRTNRKRYTYKMADKRF